MGDKTKIQWTEATWNPVRGCSEVSPGCAHCYAKIQAARFAAEGEPYHGFVTRRSRRQSRGLAMWTGAMRALGPPTLSQPLRWRRPRRVFVNSMSDLFHDGLTNEEIAAVFGVMAAAPQHQFQVLTKRATRMREWFRWVSRTNQPAGELHTALGHAMAGPTDWDPKDVHCERLLDEANDWPLRNVWLGVSVEDETRTARIRELLQTPAAVRFVSAEPLLGRIDLQPYLERCHAAKDGDCTAPSCPQLRDDEPARTGRHCPLDDWNDVDDHELPPRLDWVIVGGESQQPGGPRARPCAQEWIEEVILQCQHARVPVFTKQLGSRSVSEERVDAAGAWTWAAGYAHPKGGDPEEWPAALRVREWPTTTMTR